MSKSKRKPYFTLDGVYVPAERSCPPPNLTPDMAELDRQANMAALGTAWSTPQRGMIRRKATPEEMKVRGHVIGPDKY
jgi:hypothetical protein